MKHTKLLVFALAATLLTGCAKTGKKSGGGLKKVTYEVFHEKALEAQQLESGYAYCTVNGNIKEAEINEQYNDFVLRELDNGRPTTQTMTDTSVKTIVAIALVSSEASDVPDDEHVTWYVGNGFKASYKDEERTAMMQWNKYGLVTSCKVNADGSSMNLTFKYSK